MALTTAEVTAVSRNSGTRRIREDTQGHDQGANQAQEDTGGPAGIRKDTTLGRFGTVRPRVQIPGPRPSSCFRKAFLLDRSQPIAFGRFAPHPEAPPWLVLEHAPEIREKPVVTFAHHSAHERRHRTHKALRLHVDA